MILSHSEYFGIQRKMVSHMTTESWTKIPHVTYMYEPDITEFFEEYKNVNKNKEGENKISFNTVMLRAICEGLKAAPIMNSHIEFNRRFVTGRIDTYEDINISMPTILPNGEMMTLNLRDFGSKNLIEMTDYINDINRRARQTDLTEALYAVSYDNTMHALKEGHILRSLMKLIGANFGSCKIYHKRGKAKKEYEAIPETERLVLKDLVPGTVVISNIGSTYLNQRGATALLEIIPPMVTAFAVGAVQEKPLVVTDENGKKDIRIRKVLPLCIAFDHRVLDFGDIVPFMKRLDEIFADPDVLHYWEANKVKPSSSHKKSSKRRIHY